MTDLGTLGGTSSRSLGINDSGQVTGVSNKADGSNHAFLYSSGTMTDLGTLGGTSSKGLGINASGQITGFAYTTGDASTHAFLETGGTMLDLNTLLSHTDPLTGLITLTDATGINDSGQIVANGCYNDGSKCHAFLLTTASPNVSTDVPEPASLTLLATGLASSAALGRRRRQPVAETGEVTQES